MLPPLMLPPPMLPLLMLAPLMLPPPRLPPGPCLLLPPMPPTMLRAFRVELVCSGDGLGALLPPAVCSASTALLTSCRKAIAVRSDSEGGLGAPPPSELLREGGIAAIARCSSGAKSPRHETRRSCMARVDPVATDPWLTLSWK